MEFQKVGKKAKAKWRFSRSIMLILLLIPFVISIFSHIYDGEIGSLIFMIVSGVFVAFQLLNVIVYPIIEYIQWAYLITDDRIEIKKGIFWRTHTIIPISRVQHVCAKQGPVQRMFKLGTIEIMTAAGLHKVEELDYETAQQISDMLRNNVNNKLAEMESKEQVAQDA